MLPKLGLEYLLLLTFLALTGRCKSRVKSPRFDSTLITLDREQRERVAGALLARYPAEVLREWE